jgi:hypothetical protein
VAALRPSNLELMVDPGTQNNLHWGKTKEPHDTRFFFDGPSVFFEKLNFCQKIWMVCVLYHVMWTSDVSFFS